MSTLSLQKEEAFAVSIDEALARRLARLTKLSDFETIDDYVSFVLNNVLDQAESIEKLVVPHWSGGKETTSDYSIDQEELDKIRDELRPLVQFAC